MLRVACVSERLGNDFNEVFGGEPAEDLVETCFRNLMVSQLGPLWERG